jgi:hypothetical protein
MNFEENWNSKTQTFLSEKIYLLYFQFSLKIPLEIWTCYVLFWTGKSKKKLKEFTGQFNQRDTEERAPSIFFLRKKHSDGSRSVLFNLDAIRHIW